MIVKHDQKLEKKNCSKRFKKFYFNILKTILKIKKYPLSR
jgi:hypothetical protein